MLCVVLAMVFAGVSAVSVVDDAQHEAGIAHTHDDGFSVTIVHDAHGDAQPDQDTGPGDQQPAAGHHHVDSPAGLQLNPPSAAPILTRVEMPPSPLAHSPVEGLHPGGLERPPRPFATQA